MSTIACWLALACAPQESADSSPPACGDVFFRDGDGDGHGDPDDAVTACAAPDGFTSVHDDCDDGSAAIHPGATETCDGVDDDCDGTIDTGAIDEPTWYLDADGDGVGGTSTTARCVAPAGFVASTGDCDDAHATVSPAATESCNGIDDDCDGLVDELDPDLVGASTWYTDGDNDGYGDPSTAAPSCRQPEGTVDNGNDCDDTDDLIHPNGSEVCDDADDDCDGLVDDDDDSRTGGSTFYTDADGDGLGNLSAPVVACLLPKGSVDNADDCDDAHASVGGPTVFYYDSDLDSYGSGDPIVLCTAPGTAYVTRDGDCDDLDRNVHPGARERCNGYDDNCDALVDDDDPLVTGQPSWYADADGDGAGDAAVSVMSCAAPSGYVSLGTDCDDADASAYPKAIEYCDGVDNDCDRSVDDDVQYVDWYADTDGDGYGDADVSTNDCMPVTGAVLDASDCDDSAASVHPGATDSCANATDDDCDGAVDNCVLGVDDAFLEALSPTDGFFATTLIASDVDADGVSDLVAGAPAADAYGGEAYVVLGAPTGTVTAGDDITIDNTGSSAYVGYGLGAGDANADGVEDVLVGAPAANTAYLFLGPLTADRDLDDADASFVGPTSPISTGIDADCDADVDGDGLTDAVVGSFALSSTYRTTMSEGYLVGIVFVASGPSSGAVSLATDATYVIEGHEYQDRLGLADQRAGDLDGDGIAELVFGDEYADTWQGAVYVFPGGLAGGTYDVADVAEATLIGGDHVESFGTSVAVGDLDDDGITDLLVGAIGSSLHADDLGAVYSYLGPLSGAVDASEWEARWDGAGSVTFGQSVAVGDAAGSDALDVLLAVSADGWAGAYVQLDGGKGSIDVGDLPTLSAPQDGSKGSSVVTFVPDWDGDGRDDLVIGTTATTSPLDTKKGALTVFSSGNFP